MHTQSTLLMYPQFSTPIICSPSPPPPLRRRRSPPGQPDPDAEVIAMSPESLKAATRFTCEICKKGFQRDQNLQLHRRGHNLPWELKRRPRGREVKKVYVCPVVGCVHNAASRALGDLTGIRKHFFRKHMEKKWQCEICRKKYAIHSDWKAHSKICCTKEFSCDCGQIFPRKDALKAHKAFCEAVSKGTSTALTSNPFLPQSPQPQQAPEGHDHLQNTENYYPDSAPMWREDILPSSPAFLFNHELINQPLHGVYSNAYLPPPPPPPHMSATALLQRAAELGAFMSPKEASEMAPTEMGTNSFGFLSQGGSESTSIFRDFILESSSFGGELTRDYLSLGSLGPCGNDANVASSSSSKEH